MKRHSSSATIVLEHAARVDASSWSAVIGPLLNAGIEVIAPQIPMTSLSDDVLRTPAWKTKPSWCLLAEDDRMFSPKTQRFVAERMNAQIRSHDADHAPQISSPGTVVEIVLEAASALL